MAAGTSLVVLLLRAVVGLVVVVLTKQWRLALAVALAFVSSVVVTLVMKGWIGRARPPARLALVDVAGPSMPSTHAAITAAVAVAAVLMIKWRTPRLRLAAAIFLALAVVGIGCALVYLGAHWPTYLAAGWLIGLTLGVGSAWIASRGREVLVAPGLARHHSAPRQGTSVGLEGALTGSHVFATMEQRYLRLSFSAFPSKAVRGGKGEQILRSATVRQPQCRAASLGRLT